MTKWRCNTRSQSKTIFRNKTKKENQKKKKILKEKQNSKRCFSTETTIFRNSISKSYIFFTILQSTISMVCVTTARMASKTIDKETPLCCRDKIAAAPSTSSLSNKSLRFDEKLFWKWVKFEMIMKLKWIFDFISEATCIQYLLFY